jgi:cellulose synthase/poly-beta-1,6-N-acetylglucosamine synthase-like glycosyltransferase
MIMVVVEVIFWLAFNSLAFSYIVYPFLLTILALNKKQNTNCFSKNDELPHVSILMAVYNEEKVIREKLDSVFKTNYPLDKIEFLIGSDNSSDRTNEIIKEYAAKHPQIRFTDFERQGKANILNRLVPQAKSDILIFTDANVLFSEDLIFQLTKHFKNPEIGQVGANIVNRGIRSDGISFQEKAYIQRETFIKYQEGIIWGCSMGAFGACYALRKNLFRTIPQNFLMEDFFISMNVLEKNFKALTELDALAYEDVSNEISEEFKRKVRISAGNFQNLSVYKHLLLTLPVQPGFSLLFHKVIRWFGPLLIMVALITSATLAFMNEYYLWLFTAQIFGISIMFIEPLLSRAGIHLKPLRFISYFCWMNAALFMGWLKYLKGVNTNVWQPTKRNT